jgi:hypothetical protein
MKRGPKLPVVREDALDLLEIESPCSVPWDQMKGSAWVRHCPVCDQNVFDLSQLTHRDALALLERVEGRLCARIWRRRDGTVITADCWSRVRAARRRGWLAAAATTIVVLPALLWAVIQGALNLRAAVLPDVDELPISTAGLPDLRERLYQPRLPRRERGFVRAGKVLPRR